MAPKIAQLLFEPSPTVKVVAERRRAKAAAALCFFWTLVTIAVLIPTHKYAHPMGFKIAIWMIIAISIGYGLSRTAYYKVAAWIFLLAYLIGYGIRPYLIENFPHPNAAAVFLFMGVAMPAAAMLVPARMALVFMLANATVIATNSMVFLSGADESVRRFLVAVHIVNVSLLILMSIQAMFYSREAKEEVAAASSQALTDLSSAVAHSMNSPLNTVSATIIRLKSLLQNSPSGDQKSLECMLRLGRGLKRSSILISSLNVFISQDKTVSSKLNLIEELSTVRAVFAKLNRTVEDVTPSAFESHSIFILGDRGRVQNALLLLFSYLVRVTETSVGDVISAYVSTDGKRCGNVVAYGPNDPSIGRIIANGAEAFRQQSGIAKGSDIELIMISEIILKSGGFISYETKEGKGVFILSWPLA